MDWKLKTPNILQIKNYIKTLNISELLAKILINRNVDIATASSLLNNPYSLIQEPADIINAQAAANKIIEYLDKPNAEIWIFADYDVDGITAGYVITDFLRKVTDNEVFVYYPWRSESYGVNMIFSQNLVARKQLDNVENILLVTVDNGISCLEEIAYLKNNGIEVVVTDHHKPQNKLPNCIICNPHIDKDGIGHHLAGVGVAYKVCQLIDQHYVNSKKLKNSIIDEYLFAVAIGTVADVMPLSFENIALINIGLNQLNNSHTCHKALHLFKKYLNKEILTATDIAWDIAPRLNACGRIGNIEQGAVLFFINNSKEQEILDTIIAIDKINEDRKAYTNKAEKTIEHMNFDNDLICIFDASDYPAGISGPIAGKMAEKFGKPSFVLQGKKIMVGSARSVNGINLQLLLANELSNNNILFYGGHNTACGLKISQDKLIEFKNSMNAAIKQMIDNAEIQIVEEEIIIDGEINLNDVNNHVLNEINSLPYDKNTFPVPVFIFRNLEVIDIKPSRNNENNIRLTLKDTKGNKAQIWAWKFGKQYKAIGEPKIIDIVGTIDKDFIDRKKSTIKVIDMREVVRQWT